MRDIQLTRKDRLGRIVEGQNRLAPHDRAGGQIVGMMQTQQVADLVHRRLEPVAAVAVVPVNTRVHDGHAIVGQVLDRGQAQYTRRVNGGIQRAHVARDDRHA